MIRAYINHGRWVADCECGGAEIVSPEIKQFFCKSCHNVKHGCKPRRVRFPPKAQRLRIEELLSYRPVLNRNWLITETITDLKAENKRHNVRV